MLRLTRTAAHRYQIGTLYVHPHTMHARRWGTIPKGARYIVGLSGVSYEVAADLRTAVSLHQTLTDSRAMIVQVIVDATAPKKSGRWVDGGWLSTDSTLPGMLSMDQVNSLPPHMRKAGTTRRVTA